MQTTKVGKFSFKSIKGIGLVLILVLIIGGIILRSLLFKKPKTVTRFPATTVQQTQPLSTEEMPLVSLVPKEGGHSLLLQIKNVKNADSLEYELIYELKEGLTRGASGEIKLTQDRGEKSILLGTCSSGTCKYDEGVVGGELTISLKKGDRLHSFKTVFDVWSGNKTHQTNDHRLTIKSRGPKAAKYILLTGGGLPQAVKQTIISGPYNLTSTSEKARAEIAPNDNGQLLFWNGKEWTKVANDRPASLGTYIIVKSSS